jgi:hypothetical protein
MLGCVMLAACERDESDLYAPEDVGTLVVDCVLVVDRPFPHVYLTRTLAPDQPFSVTAAAEREATITIHGESVQVAYRSDPYLDGRYFPLLPSARVEPNTTYEISVVTTDGRTLTAVTHTPGSFAVDRWVLLDDAGESEIRELETFADLGNDVYFAPANQLVYAEGLLEARFHRTEAVAYQIGLLSLDLGSDYVIDPEFFDEEDFESLERLTSSPMFEAEDGLARLPWLAIYFQGRYKFKIYAVDENWFDLVRSSPSLSGGGPAVGGNAGEGFERPLFHVQGGIGLFGSAAVDSGGVFIVSPDSVQARASSVR